MKPLILDVLSLCQWTLALAESGARDPRDLAPMLHATDSVRRALEILQAELASDFISPALPDMSFLDHDPAAADGWLFGSEDADAQRPGSGGRER